MVEIFNRNGSMASLAEWVLGGARSRRQAGLSTYLLGWLVFFDGLASSMLVGRTMRPITDRVGLSRAKLAFIVDSTSSPIAGLSLISTWVAYEMSMIREGLVQVQWAGPGTSLQLLVQSLPYRFYNWFLLLLVFLSVWLGLDFRAMHRDERATAVVAPPEPAAGRRQWPSARVLLAFIPLLALVLVVFVGLFAQGGGLKQPLSMDSIIAAYGKANAALVFVWVTAFATLLAAALSAFWPGAETQPFTALLEGMENMFLPTLILVFAWTLNSVIKDMGTGSYLVSFLGDQAAQGWLPAAVFSLAALVSFCTGTSWGTMAIVVPLVLPLAIGVNDSGPTPVLIATVGAVLAGAVFGDHCSPISDTTIVSAFSSECDLMEHVRTQLPYAMGAGTLALLLGYAPAGAGLSPYPLLIAGGIACWLLLKFRGRRNQ
jgi:Na+/H+ antiporter NhaC